MIVKKHIAYAGIEKPQTVAELKVELLGLKNVIKIAEELISRYEQVFAIMELKQEELSKGIQTSDIDDNKKDDKLNGYGE